MGMGTHKDRLLSSLDQATGSLLPNIGHRLCFPRFIIKDLGFVLSTAIAIGVAAENALFLSDLTSASDFLVCL